MTNADRIRSMTDEELAEELVKHHTEDEIVFCLNLKECEDMVERGDDIPKHMCTKCLLEWLRTESEEK